MGVFPHLQKISSFAIQVNPSHNKSQFGCGRERRTKMVFSFVCKTICLSVFLSFSCVPFFLFLPFYLLSLSSIIVNTHNHIQTRAHTIYNTYTHTPKHTYTHTHTHTHSHIHIQFITSTMHTNIHINRFKRTYALARRHMLKFV